MSTTLHSSAYNEKNKNLGMTKVCLWIHHEDREALIAFKDKKVKLRERIKRKEARQ